MHKTYTAIALIALAGGFEGVASAGEVALDEIVVTAQKRSENLQVVPESISVLGEKALQDQGVKSFFDYGTRIPNLAFAYTGDGIGTSRTISIRGISGDNVTSVYLDETPLPDSIDPRVLDVERIEVLRGPQGTLYGARSMAGLVRIITKQPNLTSRDGHISVEASDTAHTSQPNYSGDGAVNIPLVADTAALRLSGFFDREAGYFKRRYCTNPGTAGATCWPISTSPALTSTIGDVAAQKSYGGTATLTIQANDRLTITPRFMYQKQQYNGFPLADVFAGGGPAGYPAPLPVTGPPALPPLVPQGFVQGRFFNIPEGGFDEWSLSTLGVKWGTAAGEVISSTSYFDRFVNETEDTTDFSWQAALAPGVPLPDATTEIKKYQQFVQELRFVSNPLGPWQFVVGTYYSDLHGRPPSNPEFPPSFVPGYFVATGLPIIYFNPQKPDEIFGSDGHTRITEYALFGEASYQFSPKWKGTMGLRGYQVKTAASDFEEGFGIGRVVDPLSTTTTRSANPKAQLSYQISPDVMTYVMAAKGFRPGGLVPSVPTLPVYTCEQELEAIGLTAQSARRYGADSLWNYELGAKTEWLDNHLTVNASVFDIRWKNIQQQILLNCGFGYRANAGAAESRGAELEAHARLVSGLDLSAGAGYQHAVITEASSGGTVSPQAVGDRVNQVPDWTGNAAATYTLPMGASRSLAATVTYAYVGRSFSANNNALQPRIRPSYRLLEARLALHWTSNELALVGKNLTNEQANLADSRSIGAETAGRPRLVTNQPRTIGLAYRREF